mgnify:CR=1 FL=1
MNKSKFLKKSLAMLLALMLVVAMIPLSASAAPSEKFTPKAANGQSATVEETEDGWHLYYQYTDKPSVAFEVATSGESVAYVNANGETVDYTAGTTVALPTDEDGAPTPLTIKVTNNGETTEHTITWAMANASGTVSVSRAVLGGIEADSIDNEKHTIHFTMPFGSEENSNVNNATLTVEGGTAPVASMDNHIGTNKNAADEVTVAVTPQDNSAPVNYTVIAEEEKALTEITVGDYVGELEIEDQDGQTSDKGYETGVINVPVPADFNTAPSEDLVLPVTFKVGSDYIQARLGTDDTTFTNNAEFTSGNDYNFKQDLTDSFYLSLYSNSADDVVSYEIKFVPDQKDTGITAASATLTGSATAYDAVVDGENINIVVPANGDLDSSISVKFVGPKAVGGANPSIQVLGDSSITANFNANGEATLIFAKGYTSPVRLQLLSANDEIYGYYTLTITKATTENKNPQVTSAKVVLRPGADNEYTATGVIDQTKNTITFTVPYSTTNDDVKTASGTAVYSFGKTAQTHWTNAATPYTVTTVKDGGSIGVTSNDNDNAKEYKIVFERKAAETGKTISNFQLSTADNENEKGYNNNKDFDVTVSGKEFKVTLPVGQSTDLYASYEISTGAKLYAVRAAGATDASVTGADIKAAEVSDYNATNGVGDAISSTQHADGYIYLIADETLAYAIDTGALDSKTYDQIKNDTTYKNHYTEYTLKVTSKNETGHTLTAISADDGKVSGTFRTNDKTVIDLSVPYSYANTADKEFFFDFTLDKGATFVLTKDSEDDTPIYSGGEVNYNTDTNTLESVESSFNTYGVGNISFNVAKNSSGEYALYAGTADGSKWYEIGTDDWGLAVVAEDGTSTTPYTIGKITVRDAETGGQLTSAKANNTQVTLNQTAKTGTVVMPLGTNLGQVKLTLVADEMATITINGAAYDVSKTYDLSKDLHVIVVSEDGQTTTDYTFTATVSERFSDVNPEDWFYNNVMAAVDAGIVSGQGDGIFNPYGQVTRRDFAIMVVKLLLNGEEPEEAETTPFTDVADDDYALNAIAYCAENGIISGYEGEFRPGDKITRQEAAAVMRNALELADASSDIELFSDDAKIASWAKGNVYACKAAGIFTGDNMGNFNATSSLTRAEAASIMVNAMNK